MATIVLKDFDVFDIFVEGPRNFFLTLGSFELLVLLSSPVTGATLAAYRRHRL